jgi:hypothetical protein
MGFGGGSGGSGSISAGSDVALSSPATDQVLTYDAAVSKWKNKVAAIPPNGVLYSTDPSTRPIADTTKVVIFICSTQPTAMVNNDVWLAGLGV